MIWLTYLLEANIYLGVFYLCYCLLLNRDTHYNLSRIYLLAACILAFVLPFTQLSILKPAEPQPTFAPVVTMVAQPVQQFAPLQAQQSQISFNSQDILLFAYAAGVTVALFIFAIRLYKLFRLSQMGSSERLGRYRIIYLEHDNSAFSFFNYLFLSKNIAQSATILNHEMVHIKQRHSADIIFIELLKVVNWFNPFIYLTERSLKTIHEYIADEQTAAHEQDALTYSSFLLQNAYGLQGSSIAHSFFNYNLLKKRIIMLNQKRSGRLARLKYLAVVPLCGGMLCTSTLVFSKDYGLIDLSLKTAEKTSPNTIKYLKIRDEVKDITAYSDNVTVTENGVKRTYLAKSITDADIANLLKTQNLKIEVIEVDSKTKLQIPRVEMPDTAINTTNRAAMLEFNKALSKKINYSKAARNNHIAGRVIARFDVKDAKISGVSIVRGINGDPDNEVKNALENYSGPIKLKSGSYSIPVLFAIVDAKGNVIQSAPSAKTIKRLPPPPPPVPATRSTSAVMGLNEIVVTGYGTGSALPPPPPPPAVERVNKPAANYPPPPPPIESIYINLIKYMGKHVRYPAAARDNNVNGDVLLSLSLDGNHKITDVKVVKGIGYGCDEEAARALKSYEGIINKPAGTYQLMTTFALVSEDELSKSYIPKAIDSKIINQRNFIGQALITSSVKTSATKPTTNGRIDEKPAGISNKSRALISAAQNERIPLMIVNGKKFIPPAIKDGQTYQITTEDSLKYYPPNNAIALQRWGTDAQYGTNEFFGRFTYVVKDRELVK
ncbi:hypothetical protein FPZ43_12620 [Mucilaginibacter pallidiroseus]|uniref:TonB C-terminal domain-containing protein n=1 Tax=Mucilaginibacter pallidiroseus TaxID=2599295 RepID=A0A563UCJ8_9SPHI|nr:M56 family metallopeptidase [Mucilaginibacter pallidiroseus]TWR29097.1 hypothetical protein FPZ43_12620 [Mucilaginibacter pallidiroseus]